MAATTFEQPPLDRLLGELELREAAARQAIARAKRAPPEPENLKELRAKVEAAEAKARTARERLSKSNATLGEHDRRRPNPFVGRITGALAEFEARRAQLLKTAKTMRTAEAKYSAELASAQRQLDDATARWKRESGRLMAEHLGQAQHADARLAIYDRARRIASANAQIALCGIDCVIAFAVDAGDHPEVVAAWNGLAWTDRWGVGQLGPSPLI